MGEQTNIEWTDHTFNPWIGCTKVSAGCKNCYAETLDNNRFSRTMDGGTKEIPVSHWGVGAPRHRTSETAWKQPLSWNRAEEKTGVRARVFCASLADVFDSEVPWRWRNDLFVLIEKTPHLDWQILTKRPENIMPMLRQIGEHWGLQADLPGIRTGNVWLGTSVEDQAAADKRIPELLKVPCPVRFLSCEPLLGPVSFRWADWVDYMGTIQRDGRIGHLEGLRGIHWVIVGGESGTDARAMHPDWARGIRDECDEAGVPMLFKQWGAWMPFDRDNPRPITNLLNVGPDGATTDNLCKGDGYCLMEHVGKKAAGRVLDGSTHDGYPMTATPQEAIA